MSWSFCRFSSRDLEQGRHDSKKRKDHLSTLFCAMDPISSARLFCQHPALHKLLEWRNPKLSVIIKANPGIKNRQNIFSDGDFFISEKWRNLLVLPCGFCHNFPLHQKESPSILEYPDAWQPGQSFPQQAWQFQHLLKRLMPMQKLVKVSFFRFEWNLRKEPGLYTDCLFIKIIILRISCVRVDMVCLLIVKYYKISIIVYTIIRLKPDWICFSPYYSTPQC